ncbi:hypothetical protein CMI47_11755, partial [Candidatus Pacearchaeota archaeon]|nr:hypothetical protein [Candidatus Pacearchaeota archaeon]
MWWRSRPAGTDPRSSLSPSWSKASCGEAARPGGTPATTPGGGGEAGAACKSEGAAGLPLALAVGAKGLDSEGRGGLGELRNEAQGSGLDGAQVEGGQIHGVLGGVHRCPLGRPTPERGRRVRVVAVESAAGWVTACRSVRESNGL